MNEVLSRQMLRSTKRCSSLHLREFFFFLATIVLLVQSGVPAPAWASVAVATAGDAIVVEAQDESLLTVLERLGAEAGFTVAWDGAPEAVPRFSGRRSGTLAEVLGALLRAQDHVILYGRKRGLDDGAGLTPRRIILFAPSPPGSQAAEARQSRPTSKAAAEAGDDAPADAATTADGQRRHEASATAAAAGTAATFGPGFSGVPPAATLSERGRALPDLIVDPDAAAIRVAVQVGGEVPLATYVMAHTPAGLALQQTAPGRWQPWDGQAASMVDGGLVPANGAITFEIGRSELGPAFYPVTYTVAYRAGGALKFGVFQVMPDQRPAP